MTAVDGGNQQVDGDETRVPSIARVYDYGLGGSEWYEIDRTVYEHLKTVVPHQDEVGATNRAWLERIVRYTTTYVGIDQVLDVGSGLPTRQNTHQIARELGDEVTVVYVDNDPACARRGPELVADDDYVHFLDLDLTRPEELLNDATLNSHLDLNRPVLLMHCGTLHHVADDDEPAAIAAEYTRRLASGSYVMLSHFFDPGPENPELHDLARRAERALKDEGLGTGRWRTRAELEPFFAGLELLEPGIVAPNDWWPSGPRIRTDWPDERLLACGLGRKP